MSRCQPPIVNKPCYCYASGAKHAELTIEFNSEMIPNATRMVALHHDTIASNIWPRGVTVSTLDSESSDRGSNPREAFA